MQLLNSISTRPLASGPWGQLIHISESNEVELLDYSNNARLKLEDSITSRILRLMPTNSINHFVDSSLVIQSGENWLKGDFLKGDTVALSKSALFARCPRPRSPLTSLSLLNCSTARPAFSARACRRTRSSASLRDFERCSL